MDQLVRADAHTTSRVMFANGTNEKHRPCSGCGRKAGPFRTHEATGIRYPIRPAPGDEPRVFDDDSTGRWTCWICSGFLVEKIKRMNPHLTA